MCVWKAPWLSLTQAARLGTVRMLDNAMVCAMTVSLEPASFL